MYQPGKWWPGLIPLAALWAGGTALKTDFVEADLAGKAKAAIGALPADAVDGPAVSAAGRDIRITGTGFTRQGAEQAAKAVDDSHGVRQVLVELKALDPAKPWRFSAKHDAARFALDGNVPLPSARGKINAAAKAALPSAAVADTMKYADGAPAGFEAMAIYAIGEAAKLRDGAVSLVDGAYTITGSAPTTAVYEASVAATRALPAGMTLAKADIDPPEAKPFVWGAARAGDNVTLTGFAPSDAARAAIAARAAAAFPGVAVVNRMQVARGAPAGDFAASAGYGLGELAKLSGGSVSLSDADYSISGAAASVAGYDIALAATKALPTGLKLAKADIQPAVVKPWVWSAVRDANGVTLTGFAPSEAVRSAIAARAAGVFAGVPIVNQMQIAGGAPSGDFGAAAFLALGELGKLADGKASFADARLSISGSGKSGVTSAAVTGAARDGLPQGYALAAIDVKEPVIASYVFNAEKSEGRLKLTGFYPDAKAHQDILAAAKSRFGGDTVDDQLVEGKGAPADFVAAVTSGFAYVARLASGTLSLAGANMTLKGEAYYDKAAADILAAFPASAPQGFRGQGEVKTAAAGAPLDAAACQPLLSGLLANGRILFETARADLHKDSVPLLDHIAGVSLRCKATDIEVAGYTDSDGSAERNVALSKQRAQAVVDYLVAAGVDGSRITAAGYGEARPIASNDTAEGKAQNRRIEMTVK